MLAFLHLKAAKCECEETIINGMFVAVYLEGYNNK